MNRTKIYSNIIFAIVMLLTIGTSTYAANELYKSVIGNEIKISSIKSIKNNGKASTNDEVLAAGDMEDLKQSQSDSNCLIQIKDYTYDVFKLKSTHSGGDIFTCNTDMTDKFNSMHGFNYSLIKEYLVTNPTVSIPLMKSNNVNTNTQTTNKGSMTLSQLKTHNQAGNCYVAYKGTIYNVSNNPAWVGCKHNGAMGGSDISSSFPHSLSYLSTLPVVGTLTGSVTNTPKNNNSQNDDDDKYEYEYEEHDEDEYEKEDKKGDEDEYEFEFED